MNSIIRIQPTLKHLLSLTALMVFVFFSSHSFAQDKPADGSQSKKKTTAPKFEAAWESLPYAVAVWVCVDGSPELNSVKDSISAGIKRRSRLLDPSGWSLNVMTPTNQWRRTINRSIATPENISELGAVESLQGYDKLMSVRLQNDFGKYTADVREYDLTTQQWGPLITKTTDRLEQIDALVFSGITQAFMPLARIDRVSDSDAVYLRARAVKVCVRAERNETGEWVRGDITDSPVYIRSDDRFLPIIRRTDRNGDLIKLEPIDFTYLLIEDSSNVSQIVCSIQSYHRAPLAGRTSKRAEKLALVIRPPDRPTTLRLVSRDDEDQALAGFEVWSGFPGAQKGEFEMLGKTDWRGEIDIAPSERGLRLIYIKRGARALKKLPMIPGMYPFLQTTLPNDEARLYAQGVISGLQNEILNLVAQRTLFEEEIKQALDKNDLDVARENLDLYQDLPSPQNMKNRLADEEARLKTMTTDRRETDFISNMFGTLREILNSKVMVSNESELRKTLQEKSLEQSGSGQPGN